MKCELIDFLGDDLRVVNAARVSFSKESFLEEVKRKADSFPLGLGLSEKDQKLLKYLANHDHWSPFSHVMVTMRETVPIFVARQRFKHMIGFTYNEVSRRYVDDVPEFFTPDAWRKAAENKKQGSSEETINYPQHVNRDYDFAVQACVRAYDTMLKAGVAPEQARMVLPQSMYTSYYVTGSLPAWSRAYKLRSDEHAQREIQDLAVEWNKVISNIAELKHSWSALIGEEKA